MEERLTINPEKFAYQFMNQLNHKDLVENEMEDLAKEALAAYLTAYYIAEKFNNLENEFFSESKEHGSIYQRILSELNQY